jgi:hypothetical protein
VEEEEKRSGNFFKLNKFPILISDKTKIDALKMEKCEKEEEKIK